MSEAPQGIAQDDAAPQLGDLKVEFSPTIGALFGALAKARKVFKPVVKSSINPFFKSKYADLSEVIEATKDGLSDNGLAVVQPPCYRRRDGTAEIHTFVGHSSGEWMHSVLDMPVIKMDAQAIGSAITYGRRYAYSGTLNVASESDDDANEAVSKPRVKEESPEEFDQRTSDQQNIGPAQIKAIDEALKSSGRTEEEIVAALAFIGEKRIEHIKKNQFDKFLKWAVGKKTAGKGPAPEDQARMKANKKLWATAAEFSIPEDDVKRASYEKFNVTTMTALSTAQLEEMTSWVRSVAEAS